MMGPDIASQELLEKLAMLAPEKSDAPSVKTASAPPAPLPSRLGVDFLKKLGEELEKARRAGEARADEEYSKLVKEAGLPARALGHALGVAMSSAPKNQFISGAVFGGGAGAVSGARKAEKGKRLRGALKGALIGAPIGGALHAGSGYLGRTVAERFTR